MLAGLGLFARHLRGKGGLIVALFLLGLAAAASSLASPLIGKTFIDNVVGERRFVLVPWLAAALFGLALVDLLLGTCNRIVHTKLSAGVLVEIRLRLFAQCLFAPLAEMERFRQGDLLNRFGADISKIQTLLVDGILGFFQNLLYLCVAATLLIYLSPPLAVWSFVGIGIALAITTSFRQPIEQGTRKIRDAMVDLSHFLTERLGALRAIRLHAAQAQDQQAFLNHNQNLVQKLLRFQMLDAAASGLPVLTLSASLAWIYLLGGGMIESNTITLGTFVAFVLYQGRLLAPALGLLGLLRNLQEARVSLERVGEVLKAELVHPSPIHDDELRPGALRMREVSFAYGDAPLLLHRVDLQIEPGQRIAIFGASGCGKSTLIQLLFGLREATHGQVRLGAPLQPKRACLAFAGSDPFLLHATVAENLRYGNPQADMAALERAVCLAEAAGFIAGLPERYETIIGGRGLALSDGQRQRLGLARLILTNAAILVLDEAFSALDPETEAKVRRNLFDHFQDRTFIVISHRLHGFAEFDRLYLLQSGVLRATDSETICRALGADHLGHVEPR